MTSEPRPRSVLICHGDARLDRDGLARWLASFSELVGIVELHEPPRLLVKRARRQIARCGPLRFLDVLAFRLYYRLTDARRDRDWEAATIADMAKRFPEVPKSCAVLRAETVNSSSVAAFLRECAPDFAIARCKSIMKPAIYTVPTLGTWVLHPGMCPEYRNAHGCFWALANRDLERVALTLLRVDAGVDTGPVYGYFGYAFDERRESHVRIQQRALTENLDAIRDRLLAALTNAVTPIDLTGRTSATWGMPWLTAHLRWRSAARETAQPLLRES
jgi:hypothetical protein